MEAMEHPYFYPIVNDQQQQQQQGRHPAAAMSGSPTASGANNVPNSPILSPGSTPVPAGGAVAPGPTAGQQ